MTQEQTIDAVTSYLHDNYYDDCERMAHIKLIASMATQGWGDRSLPDLIDKIALFNGIKKSKPPKKSTAQKIIEGIGFIMYGA